MSVSSATLADSLCSRAALSNIFVRESTKRLLSLLLLLQDAPIRVQVDIRQTSDETLETAADEAWRKGFV